MVWLLGVMWEQIRICGHEAGLGGWPARGRVEYGHDHNYHALMWFESVVGEKGFACHPRVALMREEARSGCVLFVHLVVWGGLEPGQRIPASVLISWDFIEPVWLAARF